MEYPKFMDAISNFENNHPGVFIRGNFRGGISVGDCVLQADSTAQKAEEFLENFK